MYPTSFAWRGNKASSARATLTWQFATRLDSDRGLERGPLRGAVCDLGAPRDKWANLVACWKDRKRADSMTLG